MPIHHLPPCRATVLVACSLALLLLSTGAAADPRDHDISVDDYFTLSATLDVAMSPDGEHVVFVDLRWEPESHKRNADLWIVHVKSGDTRRLTFDTAFDSRPRWSPDGRWIYFRSGRRRSGASAPYNGKGQVWRIGVDGEGLRAVTRIAGGISAFEVSADGGTIYYVTEKKHVEDPWRSLRSRFSTITYGHGVHEYNEIWSLDLGTWRARRLVAPKRVLVDFAVSPDDQRIAMITRPTEELISNEGWSTVDIWDRQTDKTTSLPDKLWRADAPSPYGWLESLAWSRDSGALAFAIDFDGYPAQLLVADFGAGEPRIQALDRPDELTLHSGVRPVWRGNTRNLLFVGEVRARSHVYQIDDASSARPKPGYAVTAGDVVVGVLSADRAGRTLAVTVSTATSFGDVYVASIRRGNSQLRRVSDTNPQVASWKLPTLEVVTWKSRDGVDVEGILELPYGHDRSKPLPMIVYLHGGPASSTKLRLRFWGYGRTLMAAKGYAVLAPNYRGSTGFGDKFLLDLIGHKNDIDIADILTGVDAMVERGVADPEKLGVMGWSNGGYLTNCVITHTDRFKAASSGAGVFDVAMQWGIEDTPGHVINYQGGLPWDTAEQLRQASPLYDANKIKTPTLIHVGENDPRVPQEHARALFRSLHQYLKVPTELLVYPGEGHGLSKYVHRRAKMTWDLAWFEKYVLGE